VRIRADRDDLADIFSRANRAIGTRSALPVLQGVLCEVIGGTLRATATDLEVTVRVEVPVEVMEQGQVVIPGKLLEQVVRKMPNGPVTIGVTENEIEILGKGPRFGLRPLSVDDFPVVEGGPDSGSEVDGEILASAINQVTTAASSDSARPILTGVLFESDSNGLRLVATDSYRLAIRDLPAIGIEGTGLIPARGLKELPRTVGASKVKVALLDREAVFFSDRGVLRLRLIEGSFPKYRSLLLDSYPNQIVVEKEPLLEALGRVALVAEDHIPVRLRIGSGGMDITVTRQDVGGENEHLQGEFSGTHDEVNVAFNPRFLADGVAAVESEQVRIQVVDGQKQSVVDAPDSPGFSYVLMPVKV